MQYLYRDSLLIPTDFIAVKTYKKIIFMREMCILCVEIYIGILGNEMMYLQPFCIFNSRYTTRSKLFILENRLPPKRDGLNAHMCNANK